MRGVRFLLEYSKAEDVLRAWGVISTIVVFGSARVAPTALDARLNGTTRPAVSARWPLSPGAPC